MIKLENLSLYLGTTQSWYIETSVYKITDGWSAVLYLTNPLYNTIAINSTNDISYPERHNFSVVGLTANAGNYKGSYYLKKNGGVDGVIPVGTVDVVIYPDLATATTPIDLRGHAKKVLDALEACIEGRATQADIDVVRVVVGNDVSFEQDTSKLLVWYEKYKAYYQDELRAEKIAKTGMDTRKIKVRFI